MNCATVIILRSLMRINVLLLCDKQRYLWRSCHKEVVLCHRFVWLVIPRVVHQSLDYFEVVFNARNLVLKNELCRITTYLAYLNN